jgi:hypothetical protein
MKTLKFDPMKKLAITLFFQFLFLMSFGQTVKVKGTLRDADGSPLPGATIVIKGTATGTISDIDGNYYLDAPVGSILVVTYIGYLPQEFEVTNTGSARLIRKSNKPDKQKEKATNNTNEYNYNEHKHHSQLFADTVKSAINPAYGTATMSSGMTYKIHNQKGSLDFNNLKFKGITKSKNKQILVFENKSPYTLYVPKVFANVSFSLDKNNNLPDLQTTYAQGSPVNGKLTWQGPENGELFAWGPALSHLEYDGSSYPYDKNGALVPLFNGNGFGAKSYTPYSFFKTGIQFRNSIRIEHRIGKITYFAAFKENLQNGTIPCSDFKRNTCHTGVKIKSGKASIHGEVLFSGVNSDYSSGGILSYHTLKSVLLTPPSFDNSNGNGHKSIQQRDTYYTLSGDQRSAAITFIDNPYWLMNNTIDALNSKRTMGKISFSYQLFAQSKLNVDLNADNQKTAQHAAINSGSFLFPTGIAYDRNNKLSAFSSQIALNDLKFRLYQVKCTGRINLGASNEVTGLTKNNYDAFPYEQKQGENDYDYFRTRQTYRGNIRLNIEYEDIILFSVLGHQVHFSDLNSGKGYMGGALSGGVVISNINAIRRNLDFVSYCKFYGSYGNDLKAPPLLTDASQYTTVNLRSNELFSFFPSREITYPNTLLPENSNTINLGMDLSFFSNKYCIQIEWYRKKTKQAILPEYFDNGEIGLQNLATLNSRGIDLSLNTYHTIYQWSFENTLTVTKYKTIVRKLYRGNKSIPLAGFSFASSNAVEGEPLGILVGTKYLRDYAGKPIIGNDGYPMVDLNHGIIGDPTPKWKASLLNRITYRDFEFSVVWEIRKGGKVWNGTRATLDYYGLSKGSGEQRTIRNYIYAGSTIHGTQNTTTVDFANPNNNLTENRWVRYGVTGVAEEYIEDGSWIRIQNLNLGYSFDSRLPRLMKELKVGVFMSNIVLFQKYSGVDPESALFGQPGGAGLDYFNAPSTSGYGLSIEIKL